MSALSNVIWYSVRASGFTAYLLVTLSVVLGLLLSMRWATARWPRLITNDLHNFVTLLSIAFGMVHGILAWIDPFTKFHLSEVLIPLVSHYRPLWMAFGIVALYLSIALVISTWLRPHLGYRLWRMLHAAAFAAFVFATIHGLGTGSDTQTVWAVTIYAVCVAAVLGLTAVRLARPVSKKATGHPGLAALSVGAAVLLGVWAYRGPLAAGWSVVANDGHGSGSRVAALANDPLPASAPTSLPASFHARFTGTLITKRGGFDLATIVLQGYLSGGATGKLQVTVEGAPDQSGTLQVVSSQVLLGTTAGVLTAEGTLTSANGNTLEATLKPAAGAGGPGTLLTLTWTEDGTSVSGTVQAHPS